MRKNSLCNISAYVLPITKSSLQEMQEASGLSCDELIDRMVYNWHAKDPETAAQLILDAISIHTRNLNKEDFNATMCFVLSVIPVNTIIKQIESTLPSNM